MKKIFLVIMLVLVILALNIINVVNSVEAANFAQTAKIEKIGRCETLLKYKGKNVGVSYVVHNEDGNYYPAYCLNVNLPGVGEVESYEVTIDSLITDVGLWRIVINGFPYKTIEELGLKNKDEAYTATKQAIYCYIHGNKPEDYEGIGEAGERTLQAMKNIIDNANNSTETKMTSSLKIDKNSSVWEQDKKDKNYVSKTYSVSSNAQISDYKITIEGINNAEQNLPEGLKLTDENNNEKTSFSPDEKFKILIPIYNLKNNGEFKLKVEAEVNTKPVLFGKSPSSDLQDYAVTTLKYEDGTGECIDNYGENETTIKVIKQDKETKERLKGTEFELLDSNKKVIYTNLKTDENGEVMIKNLMPGKYYLRETFTLDGYIPYEKDIEIDILLNEEITIVVNNSKEDEVEVTQEKKKILVEQTETKEIKKLPVTGM